MDDGGWSYWTFSVSDSNFVVVGLSSHCYDCLWDEDEETKRYIHLLSVVAFQVRDADITTTQ